jgi:hypothetical protein
MLLQEKEGAPQPEPEPEARSPEPRQRTTYTNARALRKGGASTRELPLLPAAEHTVSGAPVPSVRACHSEWECYMYT